MDNIKKISKSIKQEISKLSVYILTLKYRNKNKYEIYKPQEPRVILVSLIKLCNPC